jgi:hypothetical protein
MMAQMCLEKQTIAAALDDDKVASINVARPILRVDDPRLDEKPNDPIMQRRRKVLAVLGRRFAMAQQAGFNEKSVGKLAALGVKPPYDQGEYKTMWPFDGQNSCAPVNGYIMGAQGADASGVWGFGVEYPQRDPKTGQLPAGAKPQTGWVKYEPGRLPSVGDVFILNDHDPKTKAAGTAAHHCGVICQVSLDPNEFWITADGGQPDRIGPLHQDRRGQWVRRYNAKRDPENENEKEDPPDAFEAAYLVPRQLDCANPLVPMIANFYTGGGGSVLHGWRDVTHPEIKFRNDGAWDEQGTEADYEMFKKQILRVNELAKHEAKYRKVHMPTEL